MADAGSFEDVRAVALQRDGKIVVAGETDCETARCFAAMRLNPDGSLDPGFGAGGIVRVPFYLHAAWANDVAIDGQGRIVMAGVRLRGGDAQDSATVCVIRLLPDGRPDPGFSGDGVALVDHGYGNDSAEAVLLRGGKVIVAGEGRVASGSSRFGIARLRVRRPARPLLRPPRPPSRLLRRAQAGVRLRARGRAARATGGGRQRRDRGPAAADGARAAHAAAAASSAACAPRPARSAATRRPSAPPARAGSWRAAPTARPGTGPSDWALARYSPSGRLLGVTRTDFGTGEDQAEAIALTPGHATVAGSIYSSHGLARYLTR